MVTASHNPKWDNGYKVYWANGAQILSPHDKHIQAAILHNLCPQPGAFEEPAGDHPLLTDPLRRVNDAYFSVVSSNVSEQAAISALQIPIVYTAMHGVGYPYVRQAWRAAGFREDTLGGWP
jgi:phosphomannomutase